MTEQTIYYPCLMGRFTTAGHFLNTIKMYILEIGLFSLQMTTVVCTCIIQYINRLWPSRIFLNMVLFRWTSMALRVLDLKPDGTS